MHICRHGKQKVQDILLLPWQQGFPQPVSQKTLILSVVRPTLAIMKATLSYLILARGSEVSVHLNVTVIILLCFHLIHHYDVVPFVSILVYAAHIKHYITTSNNYNGYWLGCYNYYKGPWTDCHNLYNGYWIDCWNYYISCYLLFVVCVHTIQKFSSIRDQR